MMPDQPHHTRIPTCWVGPILCTGDIVGDVEVPMTTFESTLWPSTQRGARVSQKVGGIQLTLISNNMTRSFILEGDNAKIVHLAAQQFNQAPDTIAHIIQSTSSYATLDQLHTEVVGNLLFVRISIHAGQAAGHNMVTKACDAIIQHCLTVAPNLRYVSISGNYCTDKKPSAVNGILGRGKHVIADMLIPKRICEKMLRTTPQALTALNQKKNLIGSILAGSIRTANAHYANALLATYLATGQDAANIVEGSQGITHLEQRGDDLYFSVSLPHIIVGTVGNGKQHEDCRAHLTRMQCLPDDPNASERLACIIAATVCCSELSLLAAQTQQGELTRSHCLYERGQKHRETEA